MQEIPVALQGYYFLVTLALGALVGICFDFYRTCRYFRKPRGAWVLIFDLLFFLAVTFLVYAGLLLANWGEVRIYVFAGLTLGLLAYYLLVSPLALGLFRFVIKIILSLMGLIYRGGRALLGFCLALLAIPLKPLGALGRFLGKKVKGGGNSALRAGRKVMERGKKNLKNRFFKKS